MTKKILVADDSITIQKIVAMAFEKEEAIVEGVSNGNEAIDKMKRFQPHIVLADIDMPGLTGFELSKKIKDDKKLNLTKVLLLASDFEDLDEVAFKNSGADDHISKPFKSDDIIKKVNDLLEKSRPDSTQKTIKLSEANIDKTAEVAVAIKLSTDNLIKEDNSSVERTSSKVKNPAETNVKETPTELQSETKEDILDGMIKDVESLSPSTKLGEAVPTQEDEIGGELDTAFQEIVKFGLGKVPTDTPNFAGKSTRELPDTDIIVPEPENLLGKMTSSGLAKEDILGPNLIQESLSYLSEISNKSKTQKPLASHRSEKSKDLSRPVGTEDDSVVGEHIRKILENSLNAALEKEVSGLSGNITQLVRQVVQEITPKIAREIIKEEIDKVKKS